MIPYTPDYYRWQKTGSTASATEVVPLVMELVKPKSVVDLGCGTGTWLSVFQKNGVKEIRGVDGAYVTDASLVIPEERFIRHDLDTDLDLPDTFDLAMSVEVAEHLKPENAAGFVHSLVKLAPVVMFSAAIPFQGGTKHLNEQWPSYWAELFAAHGYLPVDCLRHKIWHNDRVEWWYRQNTVVYVREGALAAYPKLKEAYRPIDSRQLDLVHPVKYLMVADPKTLSLKQLVGALPGTTAQTVKRTLRSKS